MANPTHPTRKAFILSELIQEPLNSLQLLTPFILYQSLGASLWELSFFTMLRPCLALLSPYWSGRTPGIADLRKNLILADIYTLIPFALLVFFPSKWLLFIASAIQIYFHRAVMPSWMEILKLHMDGTARKSIVSYSMRLCYLLSAGLGLCWGVICDKELIPWNLLFGLTALIAASSCWIKWKMPLQYSLTPPPSNPSHPLFTPWIETWDALKMHIPLRYFQSAFMLVGVSLMIMIPLLPRFMQGDLHLSYTEIAIAKIMVQAIGFVIVSSYWQTHLNQNTFFKTGFQIFGLLALMPFCLLLCHFIPYFFYIAYFIYGIAQSGSRLIWQLSGPHFAENVPSLPFSHTNLVTVGIRGLLAPLMGGFLATCFSVNIIFILSILLCLLGALMMHLASIRFEHEKTFVIE